MSRGGEPGLETTIPALVARPLTPQLIVATDKMQIPYLDNLSMHTQHETFLTGQPASATRSNSVIPAYFLSGNEARDMEPELSPDVCAALLVTETGIVDSAGLVDSLAREIEEADYLETSGGVGVGVGVADKRRKGLADRGEGIIVRGTRVVRVDPGEKGGWVVQLETAGADGEPGDVEAVHADVLVNAAGLSATSITNSVVPENERVGMWISKGAYLCCWPVNPAHIKATTCRTRAPARASRASSTRARASTSTRLAHTSCVPPAPCDMLLSPCSTHTRTHTYAQTIDLDGNVRFGPDVEHIGDDAASAANPDYWQGHLAASAAQLESIGRAAQSYLPGIDPTRLEPDYAGFRPNIRAPGGGFFDFMIRHSPARRGFVEMLGFASPGLTSSLAAGEHVARLVRTDIWGDTTNPDKLAEGWEL